MLGKQTLANPVVAVFAFGVSFAVAKVIDGTVGSRVPPEDETSGIDLAQHAETAYTEGVHGQQQHKRPGIGQLPSAYRSGMGRGELFCSMPPSTWKIALVA